MNQSETLVYGGKITNVPGTAIEVRPKAENASRFIQETFNIYDGIPHICLDVRDGVCLQSAL